MHDEVYHQGEIAIQTRAGVRAIALRNGTVVHDTITPGGRPFLAQQRMAALASTDTNDRLWASLWFGKPGFLRSPEGQGVVFDRSLQTQISSDPLAMSIHVGSKLGMLAIDLGSRRRLRVNGVVTSCSDMIMELTVREAYPNCPKYIQRRHLSEGSSSESDMHFATGVSLDKSGREIILQADTLFVASQHSERGADVSHRGGAVGFVRVLNERLLRFPDYPGNSMFNTLGNFELDKRAALAIPSFERARLLQLSGSASLLWGAEDPRHPTGGTGRYWEFHIEQWIESSLPSTFKWELLDSSSFNPPPYAGDSDAP